MFSWDVISCDVLAGHTTLKAHQKFPPYTSFLFSTLTGCVIMDPQSPASQSLLSFHLIWNQNWYWKSVKIHWSSQQIADWHFHLSPLLNNVFYRVTFIQGCSEHFPFLISILFQGSMKQLGERICMSFSLFLSLVPVCSHFIVKAAVFYIAWMTWNKPPVCVTWWPDEGVLLLLLLHWVGEAISRGKQRLRNLVEIMPL